MSPVRDEAATRLRALMREWSRVLARLDLDPHDAREAGRRALANGTGFASEILVSGRVGETALFRAIADELGLPFAEHIDRRRLMVDQHQRLASLATRYGLPLAPMRRPDGGLAYVHARLDIDLSSMRARLAARPGLAARLVIAPPSVLRAAVLARTRARLSADARFALFTRAPEFSARYVVSGWQGLCVGVFAVLLPVCFAAWPRETILTVEIASAVLFLSCVVLRLMALPGAAPPQLSRMTRADPRDLPVYSVLVALYREREVVPQLLQALGRLQWPRAKLEIKFVCEEDDRDTVSALRMCGLRPGIEIVEVPPGGPRTKPKALAYALPLCSGEFVTLYDAEDRPHPEQLLEAWHRFRAEDDDLGCLQAPLFVTNGGSSLFSRMFAFEYAALFRGLLPMLARRRLVMPLGGTSNHFRRAALLAAGGWDPYNVTEDADLGIRMTRAGYRIATLSRPTFEDGPEDLRTWLPQRIRWFKGWMQCWLVHMRRSAALRRELGTVSFLVAQILMAGMVASALVHPVLVVSVLYAFGRLIVLGALDASETTMAAMGMASLALGYAAFIALGWRTLLPREKKGLGWLIPLTSFNWMLLSLAAWLALWEICRRPHHWHKTPHRPARSFARGSRRLGPG